MICGRFGLFQYQYFLMGIFAPGLFTSGLAVGIGGRYSMRVECIMNNIFFSQAEGQLYYG